jgi:hypothetical protein
MSGAGRRRTAVASLVLAGALVGGASGAAAAPGASTAASRPSGAVAAGALVASSASSSTVTVDAPPAPVTVRPVPARSGSGRRIVYRERSPQHVWLVDRHGRVVRDFPVSGRKDWPRPGTYRVFSKSPRSWSPTYGVTFRWMVRFAHGRSAAIGFHTIPRYRSGRLMHPVAKLGRPVGRGGCPHSADADARFLYRWASIGTKVVVLR